MAESAALTPDLEEGLITGARLLIAGKMQMAAAEVRRTGGRYDTLYRTIASSCTICAENPTPTWALRASRITQDEVERRIYLENARLELFGVPGRLPAAALDPRTRGGAGLGLPRAALPAVGHLRLRHQDPLLPRARPLGRRDADPVRHHRRRGADRGRVPAALHQRRLRLLGRLRGRRRARATAAASAAAPSTPPASSRCRATSPSTSTSPPPPTTASSPSSTTPTPTS